ncbi:MAG: ABC transporter permease [Candidatus Rokuibacteriota bacterium]
MPPRSASADRSRRLLTWLARPAVAVVVLVFWIGYVVLWDLPSYVLPHPFKVVSTFAKLAAAGVLARHALFTLQAVVLGFALGTTAAIVLGTLISRSRFVEAVLRPYIVASQTTPTLVLAPLFLVWFGFGIASKVLIAALICFFPLLVNVIIGFRSVGESELRLFRALGAGAWQTFVHLQIPSALPFIFAGLRITSILAVIGAVVGEFVGSPAGLGYLAVTAAGNLDTEILFSAVFSLMLMGLAFYLLVTLVERRVLFWHESARR